MDSFSNFLDECKLRTNSKSDGQMAHKIGVSRQLLNKYRRGDSYPKEDILLALADRAKFDPDIALLWLCTWRANGRPKRRYTEILKKLSACFVLGFIGIMSIDQTNANATINQSLNPQTNQINTSNKYKLCAFSVYLQYKCTPLPKRKTVVCINHLRRKFVDIFFYL